MHFVGCFFFFKSPKLSTRYCLAFPFYEDRESILFCGKREIVSLPVNCFITEIKGLYSSQKSTRPFVTYNCA